MARKPYIAHATVVAALALAAGCAQVPPQYPVPAAERGHLGVLDAAYDRAAWHWVRNADGRSLLSHTSVDKCFLDPDPEQDFKDPGFSLKREVKTIGGTRYEIARLYDKGQFWEAVYLRPGSKAPLLGVYSSGRCQDEAERILQTYEKSTQK